eukprot:3104337-Rhodomonas_salina.1
MSTEHAVPASKQIIICRQDINTYSLTHKLSLPLGRNLGAAPPSTIAISMSRHIYTYRLLQLFTHTHSLTGNPGPSRSLHVRTTIYYTLCWLTGNLGAAPPLDHRDLRRRRQALHVLDLLLQLRVCAPVNVSNTAVNTSTATVNSSTTAINSSCGCEYQHRHRK